MNNEQEQSLTQKELNAKNIADEALYGTKNSYILVKDIEVKLREIYENYNNEHLEYDSFYFPKIKYNGFYYNLSDLVISKTLTNTETFNSELFSFRLFSEKGFNDNVLTKINKLEFADFNVSLIKKIDDFEFEYNYLNKDSFEFVDYDVENIDYRKNLLNTISIYDYNEFIVYKDVTSENKYITFNPQFNEVKLSYVDKLNLKENNQLVDMNISNSNRYSFNVLTNNIVIINRFGTLVSDYITTAFDQPVKLKSNMRLIICEK